METTTTERGFALIRFRDARGTPCSLQDSSLATEAACWLGVDHGRGRASRMHLTAGMAGRLAIELRDHAAGGEVATREFEDRYANGCVVRMAEGGRLEVGILDDFDGGAGETMTLDRDVAASLVAPLASMLRNGTVAGEPPADWDVEEARPVPTADLPAAALGVTSLDGTDATVQELVDALHLAYDGEDLAGLRSMVGHDAAEGLHRLLAETRRLRSPDA